MKDAGYDEELLSEKLAEIMWNAADNSVVRVNRRKSL